MDKQKIVEYMRKDAALRMKIVADSYWKDPNPISYAEIEGLIAAWKRAEEIENACKGK